MISTFMIFGPVLTMLGYPLYLLVMAAVLGIIGVPRHEIAQWALRHADRQRITDLIRAARRGDHARIEPEGPHAPDLEHDLG